MKKWQEFRQNIDALRDKAVKWINWLAVTVAAVDYSGVLNSLPQIQPYIPPHLYQGALSVVAIVGFVSHNFLKHRS